MSHKPPRLMEREWATLGLDVAGKSVLDIGCHDGWFSLKAAQAGASRVVGLDLWEGRSADTKAKFLETGLEYIQADFLAVDLEKLGQFDVVLFLGVLYHLEEPLTAMRRLRKVTGGVAAIETAALPGTGSLCRFIPGNELNNDPTNWWLPTKKALVGMSEVAGFGECRIIDERDHNVGLARNGDYCRITALAS